MKNEAVIGLGSNINPKSHLDRAVNQLGKQFTVLRRSQWVRTQPIGIPDQPDFINGAVLLQTELEQQALKDELKNIEDRFGRDRSQPRFGSRVIDLDIVVWNGEIIDDDYYERDFLRNCVGEVLPELDP